MPDVVEQDGRHGARSLAVADGHALAAQGRDALAHEVHGTNRVQKTAVHGARINEIGKTQLSNTTEPLHIRVLQYLVEQVGGDTQETEYRVVDYLMFVRHSRIKWIYGIDCL